MATVTKNRYVRLNGLGNGSDLVDLQKQTIAGLLFDGSLDAERISDGQIVTNDLDAALAGEVSPGFPVILVEGVLNGNNGVLLDVAQVKVR